MAILWTVCNDMKYISSRSPYGFIVKSPRLAHSQGAKYKNEISSGEIFFIINQSEEHKSRCMWKKRHRAGNDTEIWPTASLSLAHSPSSPLPRPFPNWSTQPSSEQLHYNVIITFFVLIIESWVEANLKRRKISEEKGKRRKDIITVHGRYYCRKLHQKQYPAKGNFFLFCFIRVAVARKRMPGELRAELAKANKSQK